MTVLGEIPNKELALKEIFDALKPGGILSITEVIFDPHFQRQAKVLQYAYAAGFQKKKIFGNRFAFTVNLIKVSLVVELFIANYSKIIYSLFISFNKLFY